MKKIITAINNPKLNEELKKENNFEIIGKDIQYKEAVLEILEKNNNIDLIILSEKIPGEIELENLIKKIKLINKEIKIIIILEKENNYLEKILIKNNIVDFYYNNKINLNELIKIINKKEINMEEEIIKLKKIIEEKNKNNNLIRNKNIINYFLKTKEKLENKKREISLNKKTKKSANIKNSAKIITFSGNYKSGKTTLALIISNYLSKKNNNVLLIDGDLEKQDLSLILNKKEKFNIKKQDNKRNKFNKTYLIKNKLILNNKKIKLINFKNNIINNKIIKLLFIKINNNLYFLKEINYLIKNKKENNIKKILNKFFLKAKEKYNYIIIDLSKNNLDILNREILKISDINFFVMEANLLGINEAKKLINKYEKEFNINFKNLNLILNKNNFNSINKNINSKLIHLKNKIYKIKKLNIIKNNYFKTNYFLINKKIKKEFYKIIIKIENNYNN